MSHPYFDQAVQCLGTWIPFFILHRPLFENILQTIIDAHIKITPPPNRVFQSFYDVPLDQIRVVIVSPEPGMSIPYPACKDRTLSSWSSQGVFLMSMAWTRGGECSHRLMWEELTRHLIQYIQEQRPNALFLLIGSETWCLSEHIPRDRVFHRKSIDKALLVEVNGCLEDPIYWDSVNF